MKKLYLYLFLDICVFGNDISFEYLKHSAHENSHRLKLRSIDTTIEEARLDSIYSTLYPQLSLGYSGEYNHNLDPSASGSVSVGDTTINSTIPYEAELLRLQHMGVEECKRL